MAGGGDEEEREELASAEEGGQGIAAGRQRKTTLVGLGEELVAVTVPVTVCMALVVFLVESLGAASSASARLYLENEGGETAGEKFAGAVLNAAIIIGFVVLMTFLLVLLFRYNCVRLIWGYMGFSGFVLLFVIGGQVLHELAVRYGVRVDLATFLVALYNVATCGVLAVFIWPAPSLAKQSYLVAIGAIVSFWLTRIPEWTTWALLLGMALYDVVAVLCPGGPLKMLVDLASRRGQAIPALVYETAPRDRTRLPAAFAATMASSAPSSRLWPSQAEESEDAPLVHLPRVGPSFFLSFLFFVRGSGIAEMCASPRRASASAVTMSRKKEVMTRHEVEQVATMMVAVRMMAAKEGKWGRNRIRKKTTTAPRAQA